MSEWCKDCKEYDTEKHCCPRFNNVIKRTMNERINDVLDEIKAEIEQAYEDYEYGYSKGLVLASQIIDKYKAESK